MKTDLQKLADRRIKEIRRQSLERQTELPWVTEYRFHSTRQWRCDFACHDIAVAIEIDGGAWLKGDNQGRHTRGAGFIEDMAKINAAQLYGWIVLRYTPQQFDGWMWLCDVDTAKRRRKASG